MATTVACWAGGGGLSAAHELVERGFSVAVYEKRALPGGKARSYPTPAGCRPSTASASSGTGTAGHDGADPARPRARRERAAAPGARARDAGRPGGARPVRLRRRDAARRARRRRGLAARAPVHAALELRRAARGAVGPAELVGLRAGRAALGGVPALPGRRPDADARGGPRAGDERAHRRARSSSSCCSTSRAPASVRTACSTRRRARPGSSPGSRTCASRGVDGAAGGGRRRRCGARRRGSPARPSAGASVDRRLLRRRAAGRGHAHAALTRAARRRAAPERPRPAGHALDERDHVLPAPRTCRSCTATRSTSTPSGR